MGVTGSKIAALPVPIILKRINDCVIPDDKGAILDFVEMIDIQLSSPKTLAAAVHDLKEENGILLLLKLMKRMLEGQTVPWLLDFHSKSHWFRYRFGVDNGVCASI